MAHYKSNKSVEDMFYDSKFVHRMVFNGLLHEQMMNRVGHDTSSIQDQITATCRQLGMASYQYNHDLMMEFIDELMVQYGQFRTVSNVKALKLRLDRFFLFLLMSQIRI